MILVNFLVFVLFLKNYYCFNIDTNFPIVYTDPLQYVNSTKSSYFGYSLLLYPGSNKEAPWILIGAPRGQGPESRIKNPGICFKCGIREKCSIQQIRAQAGILGNNRIEKVDNAWFGGSMDINYRFKRVVVCAYRWINVLKKFNSEAIKDYYMRGACYWYHIDDTSNTTQRLVPLFGENGDKDTYKGTNSYVYYYAQGQAGFSAHMSQNENSLLLGAPGVFNWDGTSILYKDTNSTAPEASKLRIRKRYADPSEFASRNVANTIDTPETKAFHLFGYSSTSGYFYGENQLYYVSGAPRSNEYKGQVLIYQFDKDKDKPLKIRETRSGYQFAEYFGSSVAAGDLNNDRYDDLFVGAPFHKSDKYNEGKIYIFLGNNKALSRTNPIVVVGKSANGQFGTSIQYLGDINTDGFGDLAVSAPYEEEKSGVVYLYRGTRTGIDTTHSQRIVGKDIASEIRGFGISISRPADIDVNKYPDIAIGAHLSGYAVLLRTRPTVTIYYELDSFSSRLDYHEKLFRMKACFWYKLNQIDMPFNIAIGAHLSGHAVLLRTRPTVTIYHELDSISSRLDYNEKSFRMKACFWYKLNQIDMPIRIHRILSVDEQLGRAKLSNSHNYNETIELFANRKMCDNFTILLENSFLNKYDPISVSLTHEFIPEKEEKGKEVIYVSENVRGIDKFCVRCPVYDNYGSSLPVTRNIPFALNCGSDNICTSSINFEPTLTDIGEDNSFVLGSKNYIQLRTLIQNLGENAYIAQLAVTVPDIVTFQRTPSACVEQNISSVVCNVDNPLQKNIQKHVTLDLDMTNVNSGKYDGPLIFTIMVLTSSENDQENIKHLTVQLRREADITISGKSGEQSYSYKDISHESPNFTQIYQVEKFGSSSLNEILIDIEIPHSIRTKEGNVIDFISLYPPKGSIQNQEIMCKGSFSIIDPSSTNEGLISDDGDDSEEKEQRRRSVRQVEVITSSDTTNEKMIRENEFDKLQNRTFYINCSVPEIVCSKLSCTAASIQSGQIANVRVKMFFNISAIKNLLDKKDVISFTTHGSVKVINPPNFVQSGDRPDATDVSSLFLGDGVEPEIEYWILIVSVAAGLLLLLLLILGLIKAGFFKRTRKEELALLKKEMETQQKDTMDLSDETEEL